MSNEAQSKGECSSVIRALWNEFEPWLLAHQQATKADLTRFLERSPILPERMKELEKLFHQEHLKFVRKAWIERLNRRGISIYDWNMTEDDKRRVNKALEWTPGEVIQATTGENGDSGKDAKGKKSKTANAQPNQQRKPKNQQQQKQKQPVEKEEAGGNDDFPLLVGLGDEDEVKEEEEEEEETNKKGKQKQKQNNQKSNQNQKNQHQKPGHDQPKKGGGKSTEPSGSPAAPYSEAYVIPLNYAAPQFGDPDYELLGALDMTPFAAGIVEAKIREFYSEACEATLLFNRQISVLPRKDAIRIQEQFERRMKELAIQKRQEWKEIINAGLVRKVVQLDNVKKVDLRRFLRPRQEETSIE